MKGDLTNLLQETRDAIRDSGHKPEDIVFSDGATMTRGEYDGSEWWQFSRLFVRPATRLPITTLFPRWGGPLSEESR